MKAFWEEKKFGHKETTAVPGAFHSAVRALVGQRLIESGGDWASFVFGSSYELIAKKDFERIESDLLASGYRFDVSAVVSAKETPGKYKPLRGQDEYEIATEAVNGKLKVGHGDNVVKYPQNVLGVARYVHTADDVMELMINGVPPDTIAIIDDSGGTLTAPILESFKAVVCMGGTVRSHLGILTREFGIPCLMNAKVSGIKTGDRLELNTSAGAKTAHDYQTGVEKPADVWKLVEEFAPMSANAVTYRQLLETNNALQVLSDEIGWLCVTRTTQESKLFPLAYMLLSFFNAYYRYPTLLRKIEGRMSAEECGDRARGMGAKTTLLNMGWCMPGYYINGRELLINMGLVRPEDAVEDLVYVIDFWRRFQLAYHRNDGHLMTREFGHRSQIQPERQLQIFEADALLVVAGDPLHAAAIKFMATISQYSFLSHCECRMGICNEGPYRFGDNREMLVRDFVDLAQCDFPWLDGVADRIPYNNLTMPIAVKDTHFYLVDDWGSFESKPEFRADNIVAIGLYTSDALTDGYIPVSMNNVAELAATFNELQTVIANATAKLWERFAKWSRSEMIEAGALVYYNAPALLAHIAGVYEQSDWMEIDDRARRFVPLLNDEYGRDCLTEMLGPVSLPSQQAHDYVMSMHSNRPHRIYSPIPYGILATRDFTRTSGPVFPGSTILGEKTGKWRTSKGLLDQKEYNRAAQAFTPSACTDRYRFLDDYWLNYHHAEPAAQELYRQAQRQSRVLSGRGASLTRADIERSAGR